jgi:putative PIN family toxin of toxin-antitoxin system
MRRVVFDTNVVVSALLFPNGRLAWLRQRWRESGVVSLVSPATVQELRRVLAYPKFRLSQPSHLELLALYLPYCESLDPEEKCPIVCRDAKDQPLLDLAHSGKADLLVTGDDDLLALAGKTAFVIETPQDYGARISGDSSSGGRQDGSM